MFFHFVAPAKAEAITTSAITSASITASLGVTSGPTTDVSYTIDYEVPLAVLFSIFPTPPPPPQRKVVVGWGGEEKLNLYFERFSQQKEINSFVVKTSRAGKSSSIKKGWGGFGRK